MLQDQPSDTQASTAISAVSPPAAVVIRPMEPADAGQVLEIYQAGLDTGQASFETVAPDWEAFDAAKLPGHRFTAADADGRVLGWVAVSPVSARRVYAGVVEHSVYVLPGCHRRGSARRCSGR
jgi:L-amino acid N-acyltransferase YncA